ncbi:carbon-nitrogen hydrolase family protein [Agromyces sp. H3Y2-19a]|jgi:predicted amidohydrolase|uniref:carbon-nitrogen hydrolase family protein n=1 Tax=Agromyces TaxID=33877 RepID=UPI001E5E8272|nr:MULTISPECIES: carbon-nitrogen hydrolase family protein [Agromyces]MCD5345478.1 carbon-nitrogen hydrolase family protein [Agromyces sp. S2-1-8]MDF0515418.1 carbon-nitrogen hydrolase family protein [Agromyces chromiiresistens]
MRVAVVQTSPGIDPEANFATIRRFAAEAAEQGARLVVFPEEAMLLADDEIKPDFPDLLPAVWPGFVALIRELARQHELTVIAAGYEPNPDGSPFNTILAFGPDGEELARYHKMHTYDAFAYRESAYVTRGDRLPPIIDVDGLRVGLANCYDVRFPELFRSLSDRGVDAIALSAAWVSGKGKEEHWSVLTQARAIENVSWFLASATVGPDSAGLSRIIDPLGVVVAGLNAHDEGIVVAELDPERTATARRMLPALENRRIALAYHVN